MDYYTCTLGGAVLWSSTYLYIVNQIMIDRRWTPESANSFDRSGVTSVSLHTSKIINSIYV